MCGGEGTRLREETEFKPKALVEIGGRPILWHLMRIYAHYGYRRFVLCLGYKGEVIKDYFLNYQWRDRDFTLDLRTGQKMPRNGNEMVEDWEITFVETGASTQTGAARDTRSRTASPLRQPRHRTWSSSSTQTAARPRRRYET